MTLLMFAVSAVFLGLGFTGHLVWATAVLGAFFLVLLVLFEVEAIWPEQTGGWW